MKILIAAITCHPTAGSEAHVGWQAVSLLRHEHELWVLTSLWCKEGIEQVVFKESGWENVHFIYVDEVFGVQPPHPNRMIARLESWTRYHSWCRQAKKVADRLIKEIDFDLGHHVTYASWRMGSPLAGLGIPWIWGPIGGGERFPWRLTGILSPVAVAFEVLRGLSTKISMFSPAVRRAVKDASLILPNNSETERLLSLLGADPGRMRRLVQSFLPEEKLDRLKPESKEDPKTCGILRIVAGGNLEGRKGVAIALKALVLVKQRGIPFQYRYLGKGPELGYLRKLTERLCLSAEVEFCDSLRGEDYIRALQESHVYLLPSLREGVPLTQMEAMAAGCIPIVMDCGGAGPMARASGCEPIPVSSQREIEEAIAAKIVKGWCDTKTIKIESAAAIKAVVREYSTDFYSGKIRQFYDAVSGVENKRDPRQHEES
jgi:glycosyltransferase involved in cell wall biosynthesis